jgi:hypothetical protein
MAMLPSGSEISDAHNLLITQCSVSACRKEADRLEAARVTEDMLSVGGACHAIKPLAFLDGNASLVHACMEVMKQAEKGPDAIDDMLVRQTIERVRAMGDRFDEKLALLRLMSKK